MLLPSLRHLYGRTAEERALWRQLMHEQSGCKNTQEWCGHATCNSECGALIFHGPGHQSKGHCEETGKHDLHKSEGSGDIFRWHGDVGYSGFWDESPE